MFLSKIESINYNNLLLDISYKIVPYNTDPYENGTAAILIHINKFFNSGNILIFDNTQSFVVYGEIIYRFRYENQNELIDNTVQFELYEWKPFVFK
jgi:hypothetical protein